ncbi:hypothetical protein [Nitrosopumilus adriaticus]|nr:hypothetical protein [Nitrosopumilus adriaticus]
MDSELKQSIEKALNTSIQAYNEIKPSEKAVKKFVRQFGNVENPYNFIHGYFMGDLQGIAFATAHCQLGRNMDDKEREDVAKIIKSKAVIVEEIIKEIRDTCKGFH